MDPGSTDAALAAWFAYERFSEAQTPITQAYALTELHDAMSQFATWLPGYNYETGRVEGHDDE